jgi:lipoprotein-releasing system ATP-binding protein
MIEVQDQSAIVESAGDGSGSSGLRVFDVRKSFAGPDGNRMEVLRSVMMEVKPGESVAIMGVSGSGKSTLLHLLGGLDHPDHGSINLGSIEVTRTEPTELTEFRKKQIGFVFQFHYLLNDLTAAENVAMPLLIDRRKPKDAISIARRLLTDMGLEERQDHPISQLSGGEQQRVAVARALINEPLLILADEPTGNLDALIGEDIGKALVEYARRRSKMAIIATHNDAVARLCDRTVQLKSGRIYSSAVSV